MTAQLAKRAFVKVWWADVSSERFRLWWEKAFRIVALAGVPLVLYLGISPPPPWNPSEWFCFGRCLRARPRMSWSSSITNNAICLKRDDYLIPRKNRWKQFIHHTGSNKSIRREKPNLEDDMAPDPKIENTQNQNAKPAETFIRMMLSETFNLDSVPNTLNSWPARRNARSALNKYFI